MATTNLNIAAVSASQNQKEVTINQAFSEVDDAFASGETITIGSSNAHTLTADEMRRNFFFVIDPDGGDLPTGQITLTVASAVRRGLFFVQNNTAQTVEVINTGQTETAPTIPADSRRLLAFDLSDVVEAGGGGGGGGTLTTQDEGNTVVASTTTYNFTGPGVTASDGGGGVADVNVPGVTIQGVQPIYTGALVRLSANFDPPDDADTVIPWNTQENQQTQEGLKFWLGPDLTFTADNTTNRLTATAHGMSTGDGPFEVSSAGTLPTGLAASTNYWCIRVDDNTVQVASSLANAKSGTAVAFTDNGTGIHTINRQNRLVVPDGVTAVEVSVGIAASGDDWLVQPRKNGSLTFNGAFDLGGNTNTSGVNGRTGRTPALVVTAGDYFDFVVNAAAGVTVNTDSATWASIRALQTTTATQPQIVFGGDVLVESQSFTAQSTINFLNLNPQLGETFYAMMDIDVSTDDTEAFLRVSTDNGASFEAADYRLRIESRSSSGGSQDNSTDTATSFRFHPTNATWGIGNDVGEMARIELFLGELGNPNNYKVMHFTGAHMTTGSRPANDRGGGVWRGTTAAINALQFGVSAGTMAGQISVYRRSPTSLSAFDQVLHVQHRVTAGTAGGTPSGTGSWLTRTLNSERKNTIPGASLASNRITLPPGTYSPRIWANGFQVGKHQSRLRDTGGATTLLVSTAASAGTDAGAPSTPTVINEDFTLTATTTFELQTRVGNAATDGFGSAANFGEDEIYAEVIISKVS